MTWVIGGAVIVGLLAVGVVVMMTGGDTKDEAPLGDSAEAPSEPSQAALAPPPTTADSQPDATVTPKPDVPEPATADVIDPSPDDTPPPATGDVKQTYAAALARYETDPTNPGLLELTLTACTLGLGPDARTAFHKLIGGKMRSKAVVKCREAGIDVTSKVEGYTGPEIANQARAALEDGRAADALALAKQSNRTERNHAALELMVLAHCELKQKKSAKKLLRHVPERRRAALISDCAERGVKLRR